MQKLMEELLFCLMDRQGVGEKIAQIVLEGYHVAFQRDSAPNMKVVIYNFDDMGTKYQVAYSVDIQLVLEGR